MQGFDDIRDALDGLESEYEILIETYKNEIQTLTDEITFLRGGN